MLALRTWELPLFLVRVQRAMHTKVMRVRRLWCLLCCGGHCGGSWEAWGLRPCFILYKTCTSGKTPNFSHPHFPDLSSWNHSWEPYKTLYVKCFGDLTPTWNIFIQSDLESWVRYCPSSRAHIILSFRTRHFDQRTEGLLWLRTKFYFHKFPTPLVYLE